MLDNVRLSVPEIAAVFDYLLPDPDKLFFIRTVDDKQIYVGDRYENIAGISISSVYQNPQIIFDILDPDERINAMTSMRNCRQDPGSFQFFGYRIQNGVKDCLLNSYFLNLYNENNELFLHAGICHAIPINAGDNLLQQPLSQHELRLLSSLPKILNKEFSLITKKQPDVQPNISVKDNVYNLVLTDSNFKVTQREYQTLRLLVRGYPIKKIAAVMAISPRTVEAYIASLKCKTGCWRKCDLIEKFWPLSEQFG